MSLNLNCWVLGQIGAQSYEQMEEEHVVDVSLKKKTSFARVYHMQESERSMEEQ